MKKMAASGANFLREDLKLYKPASNLFFNEQIKKLKAEGKKIHHLAFGQSPFPIPTFAQDVLKEHAHVGEYLSMRGLPELRHNICEMHKKEDGLHHFSTSDVVVGPGSKELIFLLMCVTGGDLLLLAPTWTTYKPQTQLSQHNVIIIPSSFEDGWKLTPEMLKKAYIDNQIKKNSVLVLCNPDNPTGAAYTGVELQALSEEFRKHDLLVVSDEIYSRLSFNDDHVSLAKHYPEGTVLTSGISKWASCGGWRLGYQLFPPELRAVGNAVASAASHTYTCASAPVQHAAVSLFRFDEECRTYVNHCKRILCAVAKYSCRKLREVGVRVHMSGSGFYIFPDFRNIRKELAQRGINTGEEMCTAILRETGVALMSGGPAYLHGVEELTVRLCYINFDGSVALKASESIGLKSDLPTSFVEEQCSATSSAIDLLVEWVKNQKNQL